MYKNILVMSIGERLMAKVVDLVKLRDRECVEELCKEAREFMGGLELERYSVENPLMKGMTIHITNGLVVIECETEKADMKMVFDWIVNNWGTQGFMKVENTYGESYAHRKEYLTRCDVQEMRQKQVEEIAQQMEFGMVVNNSQVMSKIKCYMDEYYEFKETNISQ